MQKFLFDGVKGDIYDRYGLVDIRSSETNRNAQIYLNGRCWEVHLYWIENGDVKKHYRTVRKNDKPEAVELAKFWVTRR